MKTIVTSTQMAQMDAFSIEEMQIPGLVLMENAGRGTVDIAKALLSKINGTKVVIFCGPGNNGGDGYVVARHLLNAGFDVKTIVLANREKIKGDALVNFLILENMGHPLHFIKESFFSLDEKADLIIDAMLGTGVKGELSSPYDKAVEWINAQKTLVLAVDIPTGVNADNGAVGNHVIKADATATMALHKRGLLFSPGREYAGDISIVDISMPKIVEDKLSPKIWQIEGLDVQRLLPNHPADAHKNKCGTVAVLAGSKGFTGAAMLTSQAVLKSGAGLCYLASPDSLDIIYESKLTEVITWSLEDDGLGYFKESNFHNIKEKAVQQNAMAIGPGIGTQDETARLLFNLMNNLQLPLVLDADGLNLCASKINLIKNYPGEMVLTPHPGELSRLTGYKTVEILNNKIDIVKECAKNWNKVLVLKGGPSLIGCPDGRVFINSSGNAGMATAGSGDVLTGIITGFMAQGLSAEHAAISGVFIHGMSGDIVKKEIGTMGMVASNILNALPLAIHKIQKGDFEI